MFIFLSAIFHKSFLMFLFLFFALGSSLLRTQTMFFDLVIYVSGFGHVTSRASSSHVFHKMFVQIVKYQACSFDRPVGIIVKLSRSLTDLTLGMTWSFDKIVT